jgi:hypothetical protein
MVLRLKPKNRHGDFVSQITKPYVSILRPKSRNPSTLFFETKPRNLCSSSPCAWCKPHTASPDLSIVRPPSTRLVLNYRLSSAPSHLFLPQFSSLSAMPHLSPIHHEISKYVSPHEIDNRVESPKFPGFKFKPRQVNYSSKIKPWY